MTLLLVDGTPVIPNPKGVGRYAYQICLRLREHLPDDWSFKVLVHGSAQEASPPDLRDFLVPVRPASEIEHALGVLPEQVRRFGPDVLLKVNEIAGIVKGVPTVTICHDIDVLIQQAQDVRRMPYRVAIDGTKRLLRRRALQKSARVVCNSEFIRRAVQEHYGIPAARTALGYCGIDPRFYSISSHANLSEVLRRYGVKRFVLTFATGDPRENFAVLPAVAMELARLNVRTCLLVAGVREPSRYAAALREGFLTRGLVPGTHFLIEGFLGADRFADLAQLYAAADFYLELSLHEGFGMQLAEAMACGTTCLSSGRGALSEVGGTYAVPVDPVNAAAVAHAIRDAYACGLHSRDNGAQVAYTRRFSWDRTTSVIAEALRAAAASSS